MTPRNPKPANQKRGRIFPVRLTDDEHARITSAAESSHLSITDFVRKAALEKAERVETRARHEAD